LRDVQFRRFAHESAALARETKAGLARTLVRQVLVLGAPMALRRCIYRLLHGRDPYSVAQVSALNPGYAADHGLIAEWRRQGFDPWSFIATAHPVQHRAGRLFDYNQFARDRMGSLVYERGIEHVDPHADRRLLELALAVPEPMFRQNGVHRSFARAVFADRLPAEILNERRSGVQDANWFRRLNARRSTLAADVERLEGSPMARRLIDLPRVKRLLDQWPTDEHAAQVRGPMEAKAILTRAVHIGNFIRWVEGGNA
jgi:asparagine synthase (glutamine-hydrolysing)